jgi:glycosyltransferase involved in cell wall biosynthesis
MPPITAVLHTHNDALCLGRALETLLPCDQFLVLDHGSTDQTLRIAHEYAATIRTLNQRVWTQDAIAAARHPWLLVLLPSESITEGLEATLYEWKLQTEEQVSKISACSILLREETETGWNELAPMTRLIPKTWNRWDGNIPRNDPRSMLLRGDLLRFRRP